MTSAPGDACGHRRESVEMLRPGDALRQEKPVPTDSGLEHPRTERQGLNGPKTLFSFGAAQFREFHTGHSWTSWA